MRYLSSVLAGVAAVALAGSAAMSAGKSPPLHQMNLRLPDGGTVHVEYTGNVPPRVSVGRAPLDMAWPSFADFGFGPSFSELQRISANMDRQMEMLLRQAESGMRQPMVGADNGLQTIDADSLPPGTMSYSFVSSSDGRTSCSRMVEVTKPANGAKPKVVTHSSGDCKGLPRSESGATTGNSI